MNNEFKFEALTANQIVMLVNDGQFTYKGGNAVDVEVVAESMEARGHGEIMYMNGLAQSAYGFINAWQGVIDVYVIISPNFASLSAMRRMKKRINFHIRELFKNGVRRIQADVRSEEPENSRFAEFIGFKLESFMPLYGPEGDNFFRFVITRESSQWQ